MEHYYHDRKNKGHFLFPCAGSIFKNNRSFGAPSGELIDRMGLRGYSIGDAQISKYHANIIVNRGSAKAKDIVTLIEYIEEQVKTEYGFTLERELLLVGDWDS
jgi:UDP-N-acetylmuramate dehydrogenase